jgi:hypothetical protein
LRPGPLPRGVYRIDAFEISRRKALFGFGTSDAAALLSARPHILPELDVVVEAKLADAARA